ncbi:hypothetical protein CDCA_CDCA12G3437 [Cyanidium caldarium]|uniref:Sulfate adenylyltransferase n=1 Tax=Cyanidium caldarium TaxID=2771 RepID=A0AAV9IYQ5_CYACA|nr:hypothetical protein CDCA_CDCA12G3437 [Cyanidium caldarium]
MVVSPVHGGLDGPVHRLVDTLPEGEQRPGALRIAVADVDRTTLYRIADGTLSPLTGPMTETVYRQVLERQAMEVGGSWYAWTIPIFLPITEAEAAALQNGVVALLCDSAGHVFGSIEVESVFQRDVSRFLQRVYRTTRVDHPGARMWLADKRVWAVGGPISLLPYRDSRSFADIIQSPRQVRELIQRHGYQQTIAFQTRNPLHRAHEYALVFGAEEILARHPEKRTGVFLNPLVGELKSDDVPADTRVTTYRRLVDGRFLGQGDMDEALWQRAGQNLNDQLHLVGLDMRMFYGGPSEAVMHAIYRQNLGFTHFIVGRKHADAPYDDGSPIWGDFDAQQAFRGLNGALAIETVPVGFAAYFEELGRVCLVERNVGKTVVNISGTKMREILRSGQMPDERVMRRCTAEVLAQYYQRQPPES